AQAIGEAAEGAVGLLQAEQAALPDAEAEQYRGEEDEGDPARRGRGPVVEPGQQQYQYRQGDADQAADGAGVDQVAPEDRRHLVQVRMVLHLGVPFADQVDLLGVDAAGFQFVFQLFQFVQVVADVVVPVHGIPPIFCAPVPRAGRRCRPTLTWLHSSQWLGARSLTAGRSMMLRSRPLLLAW